MSWFRADFTHRTRRRSFERAALVALLTAAGAATVAPSGSPGLADSGGDCASITLASHAPFRSLDPTTTSLGGSLTVLDLVFESLYRLDPEPPFEVHPELATAMPTEVSPGVYTVALREDATFHDGSPVTADDVVYTIERIQDPELGSVHSTTVDFIESVRAVDEHTVEFTLRQPISVVAERLAKVSIISSAHAEADPEALVASPVGSGPFRVVDAVSEQRVTLERYDGYNGPRSISYDQIEIVVVADDAARVAGIQTGDYSVALRVPPAAFAALEQTDGVEISSVPSASDIVISFRADRPPFDDPRVRQAVFYAIDREDIIEKIYFGHAEPAWANVVAPELPGAAEAEPVYSFDPDRARTLLEEAGYSGEPIDILVTDLFNIPAQAPIIDANLRDVGFETNLIPGDIQAHAEYASTGDFNMWITASGLGNGAPDAEWVIRTLYVTYVPDQNAWTSDELTGLLDEALGATTPEERDERMQEVVDLVQAEAPLLPLVYANNITAWRSDVEGYTPIGRSTFNLDGASGC